MQRLLSSGFLLSQALEQWQSHAIWVISRADAPYPRRLKTRLREDAPPVLYGCGDLRLLEAGGLAVVGGTVCGVQADNLQRTVMKRDQPVTPNNETVL